MKVLIVAKLNSMPAYKSDDHLIISLIDKGVSLWVITDSALHARKYEEKGARVTLHHPKSKFSPTSISLIRSVLKEQQTELLYLLHSKAVANGAMAAIGLPVKVVAYRGAAGIYWHDPTTYLSHFHPRVDVICCLSYYIRQVVIKNDLLKNRQYPVVHKGISDSWIEKKRQIDTADYGIPPAKITIACVANLRKVKGVKYLLQAIESISAEKDFRLLLIGDKTNSPEFKEEILRVGADHKVFGLGFQDDVYNWIDTCDIYVQPSLSEGLGKSIMEAMILGKPCVVTQSGGPEELIIHGESGLIVPPKDSKAIAQAINYLMEHPQERIKMGEKAKKRIETEFSLDNFADNIYELFATTIGKKRISEKKDQA